MAITNVRLDGTNGRLLTGIDWFSNFVGRRNPKQPKLYEWFGDKADGTPPLLFDTGQVADWDTGSSAIPDLSGGYLGASGSGARASYYRSPSLGATITEIGGRFVINPGSATRTATGDIVLGISTAPIAVSGGITVDMSCHALFSKEGWSYGVWLHGVGFAVLASASYLVALADDGITEYEATVYLNGTTATIFSPDGNVTSVTDSRIASYAGQYCFFETYLGTGNTDDHNKFTHIWANTGTPKFKALEPVYNYGSQIINGFKAFIGGIYTAAIIFPTGASTGKAVISTDGSGTLGYKTLVVDGITDAVTDSAPSQNAVFDALALKQPLDSDLTTIAGLTATTDNFIVSVASAWASRTPAQVRTTLALVPGTDVQAYDADLATIAGLTATTDNIIQSVGSAWASRTPAQVKTALGLTIGTNVQAWDADLDAVAGLTATTDNFIVSVASAWASRTPAQVRTTLGLVVGTNVQAWDGDLDTIAGLTATTDNFLQSKSSAWASRTIAQVKTDLGLTGTNSGDQTFIAPRTNTTASSATPAINVDTTDIFTITALAAAITSMTSSLTGTPVNGQKLIIRIKDDGTARAITWGTSFASSGIATLLATTIISKTHTIGLIYNSTTSKWVCMAVDAVGY